MRLEDKTISKARQGDRQAQRTLYEVYSRAWFGICLRYCKQKADAEDVLQNALVNIFGKIEQYNPEKAGFNTWASKIVVNESLMFLKSKKFFAEIEDDRIESVSYSDRVEGRSYSSESLTKMIQKLPDGYRTVFNLYIMEGYTHKEISEILGISVGTSKSQLSKAKDMLRKKIEVLL